MEVPVIAVFQNQYSTFIIQKSMYFQSILTKQNKIVTFITYQESSPLLIRYNANKSTKKIRICTCFIMLFGERSNKKDGTNPSFLLLLGISTYHISNHLY